MQEDDTRLTTPSQPEADAATLTYLTNPLYHHVFKQSQKAQQESSAADLKFYRKRIVALTKELSKGPTEFSTSTSTSTSTSSSSSTSTNSTLHHLYLTYALQLVHHFKVLDKKDIVQEQYPVVGLEEEEEEEEEENDIDKQNFSLADVNDAMLKRVTTLPSLDNYVVCSDPEPSGSSKFIPLHLEIDLTAPALKTKGVTVKRKKKKEDLK